MHFYVFECVIIEGNPELSVHNDAKWVKTDELKDVDFLPADVIAAKMFLENKQ